MRARYHRRCLLYVVKLRNIKQTVVKYISQHVCLNMRFYDNVVAASPLFQEITVNHAGNFPNKFSHITESINVGTPPACFSAALIACTQSVINVLTREVATVHVYARVCWNLYVRKRGRARRRDYNSRLRQAMKVVKGSYQAFITRVSRLFTSSKLRIRVN